MRINGLGGDWVTLFALSYFVVAAYAAVAVYRDAKKSHDLFLGLHPLWWAAMTLVGSITGVVAYWALHYSNLRRNNDSEDNLD